VPATESTSDIRDNITGMPFCRETVSLISLPRRSTSSASRSISAARSAGSVAAQPDRARRAASTARSTSLAEDSGMCPSSCSVAASTTGMVADDSGCVNSPSM
jgi:hypothetical protein